MGTRATYNDLLRALDRLHAASGMPVATTLMTSTPGALDLSRSPEGWRLIERVGTSGERDLSPRMSAPELLRALDLATDLFRLKESKTLDLAEITVPKQ